MNIQQYCQENGLLLSEMFIFAYKKTVNGEMTFEEKADVIRDVNAYRVHATIPIYVSLLLTESG